MKKRAVVAYEVKDLRMVALVFQGLFAIVALFLYSAAVVPVLDAYHLACEGLLATGRVSELAPVYGHNRNSKVPYTTSFEPVVQFTTESGAPFEFRGSINNIFASYRVGEIVEVIYLPDEPHKAKINQIWQAWGWPLLLVLAATISASCAATSYIKTRSSQWPQVVK